MQFRTMYSESDVVFSPCGEKIYKYSFENPEGEIIESERNMYELIQSSRESVNFKRSIAEYGMDNDALQQNRGGLYVDTTKFGDSYTDFINRLQSVIDSSKGAYKQAFAGKGGSQAGVAGSKTPNEVGEKTSENK